LESYTKIIIGLGVIVILLGSYVFFSEALHQYLLNNRDEERLIIPSEQLKKCCEYANEEGNQKTCSVFQEYSCDKCSSVCK